MRKKIYEFFFPPKKHDIFLTYANDEHTDGAGAQLYRIFAIYALSRHYRFNYYHTPLQKVDHQGIEILEGKALDRDFIRPFNRLCEIQSDKPLPEKYQTITITNPKIGFEKAILSDARRGAVLVRIVHPHHIIDRVPMAWSACKEVSPFEYAKKPNSGPVRIAIHVRRGDVHVLDKTRILPNSYYISTAKKIKSVLTGLNIPHIFEVHSEVAKKDTIVDPNSPGVYDLTEPVKISAHGDNFQEYSEIDENINYYFNEPAIVSFTKIATADIIITSKSAFSYLGAILSPSALVLCFPFWHSPLKGWFTTTINGDFNIKNFERLCRKKFLRGRH